MADPNQIKLRFDPQHRRDVEALARARGVHANDIVKEALSLYLGPGETIRTMADHLATLRELVTTLARQQEETQMQIHEIADFIADLHRDPEYEDDGQD